jgi:prepilin-type N-terminal cleavage/methylation domain-containing protein/prepilin-type processing-associated H-X9-DG protein
MKLTPFNFLRTIQKSLEDIPSPRTAGRGVCTDETSSPLPSPPQACEGEGENKVAQQVRCARHSDLAFTLIELLVVIAVIGVLASLLLPALARTKDQGRNTVCVSQLRQVGIATRVYADENNNRLPTAELLPTAPISSTNPLPRICDVLGPDVGKRSGATNSSPVFDCPSDTEGRFAAEGSSYEWNIDLNGHRMDETTSETMKFVLAWAGPVGGPGPGGSGPIGTNVTSTNGTIQLRFDPSTTPLFTDYDDFHLRSTASGKNVVFMDGHVTPLELSAFP